MARPIPFDFVLELLAERNPITKPMFGCVGVYIDDKIVFILRDKKNPPGDDGVWFCTSAEHHPSLKEEFPALRDISIFEPGPTNTQNLPLESDDFEEAVVRACELVLRNDPRIGRVPKSKLRGRSSSKKSSKKKSARKSNGTAKAVGAKGSDKKAIGKKKTSRKSKGAAVKSSKKKALAKPQKKQPNRSISAKTSAKTYSKSSSNKPSLKNKSARSLRKK